MANDGRCAQHQNRSDCSVVEFDLSRRLRRRFFCFRIFNRSRLRGLFGPRSRSSNNSHNRRRARNRFMGWLRLFRILTDNPVGRCTRHTQVAALFTFWPPGPPPTMNVSSKSDSRSPHASIFCRSCSIFLWVTGNEIINPPTESSQPSKAFSGEP